LNAKVVVPFLKFINFFSGPCDSFNELTSYAGSLKGVSANLNSAEESTKELALSAVFLPSFP